MRPFSHRDPGIVGAALVRDDVFVEIILDGVHSLPRRVRSSGAPRRAASCSSPTRWPARGSGDGDATASAASSSACRTAPCAAPEGMLAGSVLTMIDAVRNLHALGVPLEDALGAASAVPARVARAARRRPARRRRAAPTSSCSTTTSRSKACSSEVKRVSLPEPVRRRTSPARASSPRSASSRAALRRLLEHEDEFARRRADVSARARAARPHRRPRLVRQRRDVRRLRVRRAAGLDGAARLDRAHRLLRRRVRPRRLDGARRCRSPGARRTSSST